LASKARKTAALADGTLDWAVSGERSHVIYTAGYRGLLPGGGNDRDELPGEQGNAGMTLGAMGVFILRRSRRGSKDIVFQRSRNGFGFHKNRP